MTNQTPMFNVRMFKPAVPGTSTWSLIHWKFVIDSSFEFRHSNFLHYHGSNDLHARPTRSPLQAPPCDRHHHGRAGGDWAGGGGQGAGRPGGAEARAVRDFWDERALE